MRAANCVAASRRLDRPPWADDNRMEWTLIGRKALRHSPQCGITTPCVVAKEIAKQGLSPVYPERDARTRLPSARRTLSSALRKAVTPTIWFRYAIE